MFSKKIFHAQAKQEVVEQTPVDYNDVVDKPQINDVTLTGNKTSSDLNLVSTDSTSQTILGDKNFKNGAIIGQLGGSRMIRVSYAPTSDGTQRLALGNSAERPLALVSDVTSEQQARATKDEELQASIEEIKGSVATNQASIEEVKSSIENVKTSVEDTKLSTLPDVDVTNATDGDFLEYDSTQGKWVSASENFVTNNATGSNALAIGDNAKATGEFACQIGPGTNSAEQTLNFLGYRILEKDGRIPNTRLRGCAIPDWANSEVRLNDTEYTAETDGTLFIQADLGSWCYFIVNGFQYPIGGSVGGHMFDFRIGKGDKYKFQAGNTTALSLLWVPDKGS